MTFFVDDRLSYEFLLVKGILNAYAAESHYVEVQYINPFTHPEEAIKYNVFKTGTLFFEFGMVSQELDMRSFFYEDSTNDYFRAEEVLSNTILTFSSKQLRTLVLRCTFREIILDTSKEGLSFLNEELSRYRLNSIVINPNISPIDSSCHVLVIASPETALTQRAIGHIEQYSKT